MADAVKSRLYSRRLRFESLESRRVLSITVDTLVDENNGVGAGAGTSLREAIAAAVAGDTIDFSVTGTIEVASTLTVDKSLSISGPGVNLLTIRAFDPTPSIKSGDGIRIFRFGDADATNLLENSISGLTLTGADVFLDGGGAIWTSENLVVSDCVLTDNRCGPSNAQTFGGGGAIQSFALNGQTPIATSLTVRNCVLSGNSAPNAEGGAIRKRFGTLLIEDCTITDNSASFGGGLSASDQNVVVQINRSTIGNNRLTSTGGYGGGVFVTFGTLSVANSSITGNIAATSGGGIRTNDSMTLTDTVVSNNSAATNSPGQGGGVWAFNSVFATRCTISNNTASGSGGGVYARYVSLSDCTISGNSASSGGGVGVPTSNQSRSIVKRCTISDNTATGPNGGGGGFMGGIFTISESTIHGNRAAQGGGIWGNGTNANPVIVDRSTLSANTATGTSGGFGGGGIKCTILTMTDSTVSGNTATRGGGIYASSGTVINSTISGNTATTFAGALSMSGMVTSSTITANTSPAASPGAVRNATFRSSIIAGNTNGDAALGAFSQGYNMVGTTVVPSFNNVGDQNGVTDPMLGPLADNGGPTKTHLLLAGSPAIDAGDPAAVAGVNLVPLYDQRGKPYTRIWDGDESGGARIDIGAVESQTLPLPPAVYGDYNSDGVVDGGDYVLSRKTVGATVAPYSGADGSGNGAVGSEDYVVWRAHYGEIYAAGSGTSADIAMAGSESLMGVVGGTEAAMPFAEVQGVPAGEIEPVKIVRCARVRLPAEPGAAERLRDDALMAWIEAAGSVRRSQATEFEMVSDSAEPDANEHSCELLDVAVGELVGAAVLCLSS